MNQRNFRTSFDRPCKAPPPQKAPQDPHPCKFTNFPKLPQSIKSYSRDLHQPKNRNECVHLVPPTQIPNSKTKQTGKECEGLERGKAFDEKLRALYFMSNFLSVFGWQACAAIFSNNSKKIQNRSSPLTFPCCW
jgi:hypothetical protein